MTGSEVDALAPAAPTPIPGEHIDPPLKPTAKLLERIEGRSRTAAVGFRAFERFSLANTSLLAAGTAYYLFLSIFAVVAVAFGIAALIGSEQLTDAVNNALVTAFPNLTGAGGIDPESLRRVGQATSIVGLLVLLYSGTSAVNAAHKSLHLIYGAPKDGRNYVLLRARQLLWVLVLAPLILLSFAPSVLVTFTGPVLDYLGASSTAGEVVLWTLTTMLALLFNFVVLYLMLNNLGGIRPDRRSVVLGSVLGAVIIQVIKSLLSSIVAWSIAKPQYGAFAAPIAMLFVLYLLTLVTYLAGCWTAGLAEQDQADDRAHDDGDGLAPNRADAEDQVGSDDPNSGGAHDKIKSPPRQGGTGPRPDTV